MCTGVDGTELMFWLYKLEKQLTIQYTNVYIQDYYKTIQDPFPTHACTLMSKGYVDRSEGTEPH